MSHAKETASIVGLLSLAFILGLEWDWVEKLWCDKWEDLIVTTVGTVLGFGTAILLYLQQIADTKRKEQTEELRRHIEHVRWLLGVFKQLIDYAKQQSEELDSFLQKLHKEPSEIHQLPSIASYAIQRLMSPDNAPTFHSYNTLFANDLDKENNYRDLIRASDAVVASISLIIDKFQEYRKSLYSRKLALKAMIEENADDLSSLYLSMKPGGTQPSWFDSWTYKSLNIYLIFYNKHLIKFSRPQKDFISDFVTPLKRVLVVHPHIQGADTLLSKLKKSNVSFTDLVFESYNFQTGLKRDATKQRQAIRQLEKIYNKLKEKCDIAESSLK